MDKLRAMEVFIRIVEAGSLTRAAESLDCSPPSVVRMLAALEREVGARLLNRTTRRIHLTDDGAIYLEHCRTILAALREAEAALESRRASPQGRLAVTAPVLFGRRYVAPILNDFLAAYPSVNAELLLLDRTVDMIEEGMDLGVRIGSLPDSSSIAIPVGTLRRVVCASPQYLRKHGVPRTPASLRDHACVRFTALTPGREWHFRVRGRPFRVPVPTRLSCNQVDAAVAACMEGVGVCTFLSYQVAAAVGAKKLRHVLTGFEPEPIPVQVIYPHARPPSATVRAFVETVVSRLRSTRFV